MTARVAVADHPIPAGPLAVRWLGYELPCFRAGAVQHVHVEFENAGSLPWVAADGHGFELGYHWLDLRGNPIVYAGIWSPLRDTVVPGQRHSAWCAVRGAMPPGRYRLALDIVHTGRLWFHEVGNRRLELEVEVLPRLAERVLRFESEVPAPGKHGAAVSSSASTASGAVAFVGACDEDEDWAQQVLSAHDEGFAVVAGAVAPRGARSARRRLERELARWRPGFGRSPGWQEPLLCPSIAVELLPAVSWLEPIAGLPAIAPASLAEPWLCDGRLQLSLAADAGTG